MATIAALPHNSLCGVIIRGEAFIDDTLIAKQALSDKHGLAEERRNGGGSGGNLWMDSVRGCSSSLIAQRSQLCGVQSLLDKVVRPLANDLGNTVHISLAECSRRKGCPLVESTLLPLLEHAGPSIRLISTQTQCRSRSQLDGFHRAIATFARGARDVGRTLSDYALVVIVRADFEWRRQVLPMTQWSGDFSRFNFIQRARECGSISTSPVASQRFVQDRMHLMPGAMLEEWDKRVLGAEPGCFGGPNGVDQATGQSESGHGCAAVAAKSFGADRLGEVYNFPCYRVDHSRHDGRGRPMNVVAPERSWRMTPHCVRLAPPGEWDENSSMLLAAVVALRKKIEGVEESAFAL